MHLTYDAHADAAYLALVPVRAGAVAQSRGFTPWLTGDFDADGRLVGLEILDARAHLPASALDEADGAAEELTLVEAAALLGRSPTTLRVQIRNGRLPARKQGRDWLVTRAALETYALAVGADAPPRPHARRARRRAPRAG